MQIEYTGRQVTVTRNLRKQAETGVERIEKILGKITSVHIILSTAKYRHTAEVTIKTRLTRIVSTAECTNMETSLRDALDKAETQAVRASKKLQAKKRQPKEEKATAEPQLLRPRRPAKPATPTAAAAAAAPTATTTAPAAALRSSGNGRGKHVIPVTVHSFPARAPMQEPHITRSTDAVALRPMTLEEAVKEAEFRDHDVFVFRDNEGGVKVLHRTRDGKMELIEAP
ncbi:MAG TPA: ribosome-associated translation inhibitor RaiA [Acidobacteriaceae bacterium]|nr:ribosome-associated translation inhibitor RaiA [Acidobacteriaceae bacterium]